MRRSKKYLSLAVLLIAGGCASLPTGPSVRVLPTPGKPFEQFMREDAVCRRYAEMQIGINPKEGSNQNVAQGAALGTLLGAAAGAAFGAAAGNAGAGAAIGGGTGLLFGTASGASAGEVYGSEAQQRYDNTYVQCMYASGNQIPGVRVRRSYPSPPSSYSSPPDVPPDYYGPRY
jgi:hypothetical protein